MGRQELMLKRLNTPMAFWKEVFKDSEREAHEMDDQIVFSSLTTIVVNSEVTG